MQNINPTKTKMRVVEASIRKSNFNKFLLGFNKIEAINEASRCLGCTIPKCKDGCPIKNNIPEFIKATKEENFKLAYEILLDKSIMPDICSIVCPHELQCEGHCIRGLKQDPVSISSIERFVAEWAVENNLDMDELIKPNGKKVACIGSGPSSLSFALYLAKKGYKVTIYEKENFLGGVLTWGIPNYRLDNSITQRYIDRLTRLGAEFILNYEVNKDHPLTNLINNYDAIFIGTGAPIPNKMKIENEDLEGIYLADEFLKTINLNKTDTNGKKYFDKIGKNVLVVGGGNVAIDAARNAIRLPQVESVTIVYRRSEDEMPACKEELLHAKEEGILFKTLVNPVKFITKNNKQIQVECAIMELGDLDSSGRRKPIESNKPHLIIDVDNVILALGFNNNAEIGLTTSGLEIDKYGCFLVNENNETTLNNVYAGGDAVTGASTVISAMKAGLNAARHFDSKNN